MVLKLAQARVRDQTNFNKLTKKRRKKVRALLKKHIRRIPASISGNVQLIHEEFETFYPKENSVDFLIALKSLVYALNQVDNTGTEHELKDLMSRYLRSLRIGGTGVFSGGEIQYMLELYQQAKMVNAFQIRKIAMKYEGCGIILDHTSLSAGCD